MALAKPIEAKLRPSTNTSMARMGLSSAIKSSSFSGNKVACDTLSFSNEPRHHKPQFIADTTGLMSVPFYTSSDISRCFSNLIFAGILRGSFS